MGSSFWLQVAAVALAIWPIEARIVYGQFITLSEREFVLAARAVGLSTFHIIFREILPQRLADGHRPGLARRQHGDPDRGPASAFSGCPIRRCRAGARC